MTRMPALWPRREVQGEKRSVLTTAAERRLGQALRREAGGDRGALATPRPGCGGRCSRGAARPGRDLPQAPVSPTGIGVRGTVLFSSTFQLKIEASRKEFKQCCCSFY